MFHICKILWKKWYFLRFSFYSFLARYNRINNGQTMTWGSKSDVLAIHNKCYIDYNSHLFDPVISFFIYYNSPFQHIEQIVMLHLDKSSAQLNSFCKFTSMIEYNFKKNRNIDKKIEYRLFCYDVVYITKQKISWISPFLRWIFISVIGLLLKTL